MCPRETKIDKFCNMATGTQQKQELFKAIWATAEDLRNSVDGWDFKAYVLGILFYRFIYENITNYNNKLQAEDTRLRTDIVELNRRLEKIVARESVLRGEKDAIVAELEGGVA